MKGWIVILTDKNSGRVSYITNPKPNKLYSSSSSCRDRALVYTEKPLLDDILHDGQIAELEEVEI
ncbi:TPA: hypothetical protein ACGF2G_002361 [Vibrio cholerae]|nr:hypothetical protein [Vibrio cholerae]EGR0451257.1 hypothetical protein [Vibrio cholerae]EJL6706105.1 hypothetical protein [Vibrio cholerae]MVB23156.1 hypothetical protein [Vibrio cholerae]MVB51074.1 hypothetical protein [Vibrio cholerae]